MRVPDLIVLNKSDLVNKDSIHSRNENEIAVSLKLSIDLEQLRTALSELVRARSYLSVIRSRHILAVEKTIRKLNDVLDGQDQAIEVLAEELRDACRIMSSITGRIDVEDLLGRIFSEFCIGK